MKSILTLTHVPLAVALVIVSAVSHVTAADAEKHRVLDAGALPNDVRLKDPKDLHGYFPFIVPETKAAWEQRQAELKQRVLVATGLFPMPEKTPLNAVIHGKVQRDGFTVEKVYFESLPGHFVSGLLFRPEGEVTGKRPAVLSPHGHGGRLHDYGEAKMDALIESGAELYRESGRFPKLARCAQLARMGCVTFIFDMLGYVDSEQISRHRAHGYAKRHPGLETAENWGFYGAQAEGRLHSIFGLQTWNCVRSLDFLASLSDVDAERMAVTGGSGGGTQTIMIGAIDERPIAGFPNGMVSTSMQGGCTCENCSLLRIGTGNVELAALFAPRPQAMTAANDWTKEMMTKGYPELRQLYAMLGVEENVYCEPMLHFPHNYNAVSRSIMYSWMNKHLGLGLEEPIKELDWKPLTAEEYTVWNDEHPAPPKGDDYERKLLKQMDQRDRAALFNHAPANESETETYFATVRAAWETLIGRGMPNATDIERTNVWKETRANYIEIGDLLTLKSKGEQLPVVSVYPKSDKWNKKVMLWIDGQGKSGMFPGGKPHADLLRLVDAGYAVVAVDLYGQGEFVTDSETPSQNRTVKNPRTFAGYTYGYNDTMFARRVHDILTVTAWIHGDEHEAKSLQAIGVNGGGPLLAAARAIAGAQIASAAIDTEGFRFASLEDWRAPDFVPGAIKYGDLPTLLALSAPNRLWIGGEKAAPAILQQGYQAAGKPDAVSVAKTEADATTAAIDWILQSR
ncbi:Acetyl xylan esterase (AXE1) [Novipirellula galeiformis]|uniref:Acetyl xylan esterase (AXE1) n=1 Tax=Novipirellula galeiformis TaxID=2528004 RepID=A0A5C6C3F6_9BACT|nr:acetylxylan esterase [Novipirellula galeiformis]TWU17389.1 Acetyl xylan esterase (AXE1) [Novipirellula galeiformis]